MNPASYTQGNYQLETGRSHSTLPQVRVDFRHNADAGYLGFGFKLGASYRDLTQAYDYQQSTLNPVKPATTLAEFKRLTLRQNEGGPDAAMTTEHPASLDDMLAAARGRLMLNLDVQAGLYPDVIAAVKRAGMTDEVLIKEPTGIGSPPLAATPPFDAVPFMPILASAGDGSDLGAVARQQAANAPPVGFEMPHMHAADLLPIVALARKRHIRVWANSLNDGFIVDYGGDNDAVHDPAGVWGRDISSGVTPIQTDEPEDLLAYLERN